MSDHVVVGLYDTSGTAEDVRNRRKYPAEVEAFPREEQAKPAP